MKRPPTRKRTQRLDQRRGALFPWVDKNTRVVPPDITFRDRMTIALGDRRLTLLYAGPAHSSSDMMMLVEPDGVLFAGDIVQNSRIPHMNSDDVSTTQWLAALARWKSSIRNSSFPATARHRRRRKRRSPSRATTFNIVRSAMATAVKDWTDFDVAYETTDWSKYRDMPAFAANNRGNAYRIYLELEQSQFKADKP